MGTTGGKGSGGSGASSMGGKVGSGGATGSGGTTGAARGAVSMHIIATPGCSLMDQYQDFPIVPGGRPVTAAGVVKMSEHGTVDASGPVAVVCKLLGTVAPFTLTALVGIGEFDAERRVSFTSPLPPGQASIGSLLTFGPDLPEDYGAGEPALCTFTATEVDPLIGKASGLFVCGTLEGRTSLEKCKVGESYFAFENCSR